MYMFGQFPVQFKAMVSKQGSKSGADISGDPGTRPLIFS